VHEDIADHFRGHQANPDHYARAVTAYVLIPGACHGGWWYDDLSERLRLEGHLSQAITPAGLEDTPCIDRLINLDTHIEQASAAVTEMTGDDASPERVVLVGHSYAGSVITGVADWMPGRVKALVYLDAFLPCDGDSCWTMTNDEQRAWYTAGARRTGYGVDPLPFFDERARPHPVATLLQAIRLTGAWRSVPTKIYVTALSWPGESPMAGSTARAREDPGFETQEWDTRHNVMADGPGRVLDLIRNL
jgi:pimeloyl-ACP methyl ester carboxylesterase